MRKILRSEETSFSYERQVQPRPRLGRWKEELDRLVAANAEAPARERLTLIRIFEELRAFGYGERNLASTPDLFSDVLTRTTCNQAE